MTFHPHARLLGAACLVALALNACQTYPVQTAAPATARTAAGLVLDAGEPGGVMLTFVSRLAASRRVLATAPFVASDVHETEVALYQIEVDQDTGAEHATLKRTGAIAGDPEGQAITLSNLRKSTAYRLDFKAKATDGTVLTSPGVQGFAFTLDASGVADLEGPLTLALAGGTMDATTGTFPGFEVSEGGYPVKGYVEAFATLPALSAGLTFAADGTAYTVSGTDIVKVTPDGTVTPLAITGMTAPQDLALDATGTNLYVADMGTDNLLKVAVTGGAATSASTPITDPKSVALGPDGHLYVSTTNRVVRVNRAGDVGEYLSAYDQGKKDLEGENVLIFGDDPASIIYNNGKIALRAATISLRGLSFGPKGDLYVADAGNGHVWKVAPDGTLALETEFSGRKPLDVIVGTDGRRYFATTDARLYFADGQGLEPLAGGAASGGADGAFGAAVKFTATAAIGQDPNGYLYVVDSGASSHHLRKVL